MAGASRKYHKSVTSRKGGDKSGNRLIKKEGWEG